MLLIRIFLLIISFMAGFVAAAHDMTHSASAQKALQEMQKALQGVETQKDFVKYSNEDGGTVFLAQMISRYGAAHVCSTLNQVKTEDLALFLVTLESGDLPSLFCKQSLLDKYNGFIHDQSEKLLVDQMQRSGFEVLNRNNMQWNSAPLYVSETRPQVHRSSMSRGTFVLTFDDGPHPKRTPKLLKILDRYGVKALFFPVGKNVQAHPAIVRDMEAKGHSIGGHTWSHPDLSKKSSSNALREVQAGFDALVNVLGFSDPFFRFPYMGINNSVRNYLQRNDIHEFLWAIDSNDWKYRNPETLLNYSLRQVDNQGRGIILFHDIQPQTIAMMPAFLEAMISRGYKFSVYK